MKCKNCQDPLEKNAQFCDNCGAKVITSRITFKLLLTEVFTNVFGIDSKFFLTIRKMVTHPQEVINEYINGVRKRYINPFAFLAVGAGLSVIIFNYFADDFIALQSAAQTEQIKELKEKASFEASEHPNLSEKEIKKLVIEKKVAQMQLDFNSNMWQFMLRYFNLLTFVLLLVYALISKWTFWKPHNFGEHIVINAYVYGFTTYLTLLVFLLAIITHPALYMVTFFAYIFYYMYVFGKLYKLSIGKNILKLFRFLIGLFVVFTITIILGILLTTLAAYLGWINFNVNL